MINVLRRAAQPLLNRVPRLRSLALDAVDVAVRPVLWPFRLEAPASRAHEDRVIEARTDDLNRAAEDYFASYAHPEHLLDKPFSEAESCGRRLIDAGVLFDALRLEPGDTVMELGAGTCWLSHFLNRYGCRTMAVDVSSTALAIGRRVFESDARTRWDLGPEFLAYDGHTLPFADASVDRVVICDAYHHLPNPTALLREMRRVLRPDGMVAMSEPGRGHEDAASSIAEVSATGVLENELSLERIAEQALASGFRAARVVIAPERPIAEIDARDLRGFMGGRGFARYWRDLRAALDGHHFILLFAGDPQPTTRRPRRLKARFRKSEGAAAVTLESGAAGRVTLDIDNIGDTRWMSAAGLPGWTRVGAHLSHADAKRTIADFDWVRASLPHDVEPERSVRLFVTLPPITTPGEYILTFDLVIEGRAWFAERGSTPIDVRCVVRPRVL